MIEISKEMRFCLDFTMADSFMTKKIERRISGHGISYSEYIVLFHLGNAVDKTLRRIDLAEKVALTPSGITRMLKPMEKIGLISKEANARDARVSLVKLTESGERILNEASESMEFTAGEILNGIDPVEFKSMEEFLKKYSGTLI